MIAAKNPIDYAQRIRSLNAVKAINDVVKYSKAFVSKDSTEHFKVTRTAGGDWFAERSKLENSICDGVVAVLRHLRDRGGNYEQELREGLTKVQLYIVKVPDNTDLNRYFEVMNTRGEQLDPQDIVKAKLIQHITDVKKRNRFAQIWNACSDMNGYVQMHFPPKVRDELFGDKWQDLLKLEMGDGEQTKEEGGMSICEALLTGDEHVEPDGSSTEDGAEMAEGGDDPIRFRSVIYFPHFLLNVLRVFNRSNGNAELDGSELDVSKMIKSFEKLFGHGDEEEIAWKFAECLLRCRYLFDKYIVKRDYERDQIDGDWSIKQLRQSADEGGKKRTAFYVPTEWSAAEGTETNVKDEEILMLQSCLRVTYTEFKGMHWITKLLDWLYRNADEGISLNDFVRVTERIVGEAAFKGVEMIKTEKCRMGTATPHIVFNYLDYLLWKKARSGREFIDQGGTLKPFVFAYRNSVEHWYPQHPENLEPWDEQDDAGRRAVDQFGNLCVVQPSENSKFSNLRPAAKKAQYFEDTISRGSLKLRLMAALTKDSQETQWKDACVNHGEEMLSLLESSLVKLKEAK